MSLGNQVNLIVFLANVECSVTSPLAVKHYC